MIKTAILMLATSTIMTTGFAFAANDAPGHQTTQQTSATTKDFGKLSVEGSKAFQELTLTRLAIFDGRTDDAKKFVHESEKDFGQAKTDESVFTKAEADLKSPANQTAESAALNSSSPAATPPEQMKTPVAWLPVDGAVFINEDYSANPKKASAVADANKSLKAGDRQAAMEKLKLAEVDVESTLAVVPLKQTMTDVHQAAELIDNGKYYEASQMLHHAQSGERFDVTVASGAQNGSSKSASTPPGNATAK